MGQVARLGHQGDTRAQSFPVPMDDIRHVIPLEDTDSGEMKIVIVDHAYAAGPYNERPPHSKLPRHSRYVSGLNIEIPWPVEEKPAITDGDMDTLRVEVETSTFDRLSESRRSPRLSLTSCATNIPSSVPVMIRSTCRRRSWKTTARNTRKVCL